MTTLLQRLATLPKSLWAAALALTTLAAFSSTVTLPFINFDDPAYITNNPNVADGLTWESLRWAFFGFGVVNYHPITWISHLVDVDVFGFNAGGHHLTSLLLHVANAVLCFYVVDALLRRRDLAVVVAAVFALHPQRVESVAWVSERKDVLSGFFFFLMLLLYVRGHREDRASLRIGAVVCFVFGLLAKPMLVTAPAVLVLVDVAFLDRGRASLRDFARVCTEKLPLVALSLLESWATVIAQAEVMTRTIGMTFGDRMSGVITSIARYIGLFFVPTGLSPLYALHAEAWTPARVGIAVAVVVGASVVAIVVVKRSLIPLAGWLWFIGMLLPVIGIVQVGAQAMADRYTYLPHIGLVFVVVWIGDFVASKVGQRAVAGGVAFVYVVLCAGLTLHQLTFWRSERALFQQAIDVDADNALAHHIVAGACAEAREFDCAVDHAETAARLNDADPHFRERLSLIYVRAGRFDDATPLLERLVKEDSSSSAWRLLGDIDRLRGDDARALARYQNARALGEDVSFDVGRVLLQLGRAREAVAELAVVVDAKGDAAGAPAYYLGRALAESGEKEKGRAMLQRALTAARANDDAALADKAAAALAGLD